MLKFFEIEFIYNIGQDTCNFIHTNPFVFRDQVIVGYVGVSGDLLCQEMVWYGGDRLRMKKILATESIQNVLLW